MKTLYVKGPLTLCLGCWISRLGNDVLCDALLRRYVNLPENATQIWVHVSTKPVRGATRFRLTPAEDIYTGVELPERKTPILLFGSLSEWGRRIPGNRTSLWGWIEYETAPLTRPEETSDENT